MSEHEGHNGPPPAVRAPGEPLPAPRAPAPEPIDPEAVRQFQQFQQFQELMRQGDLLPLPLPPRKPWWRKALASKTVRRLVLLLIIVLGLYWAYQHYFGTNDDLPASETGGHRFTDRTLLQKEPHSAVRMVYQRVAENVPDVACGQFTEEAARQFATDIGAADCPAAVAMLHAQVTGPKNAYAEPFFPSEYRNVSSSASTLEISSCKLDVSGGPKLGWFRLQKVEREQWIITQHRQESC